MNKVIPIAAAFIASASIAWIAGLPAPATIAKPDSPKPPRPPRLALSKASIANDPEFAAVLEKIRNSAEPKEKLERIHGLAHDIPDEDLGKWITHRIFKDVDPIAETAFYFTLFGRYSTVDPAKCTLALSKEPSYGLKSHIRRWAAADPNALLEFAARTGDVDLRSKLMAAGYAEVAKNDPKAALAAVSGETETYFLIQAVIPVVAGSNIQLALEWVDDPRNNNHREDAQLAIAGIWFARDFNAALAWARTQETSKRLLQTAAESMDGTPSAVLGRFGELPPDLMMSVLSGCQKTSANLDEWLDFDYEKYAGQNPELASTTRAQVITRAVYIDGAKAIAALEKHGLPPTHTRMAGFPDRLNLQFHGLHQAFQVMGGEIMERWLRLVGDDIAAELNRQPSGTTLQKPNIPLAPAEAMKQLAETGSVTDKGFLARWTAADMEEAITALESVPPEQFENLSRFVKGQAGTYLPLRDKILREAARKNVGIAGFIYTNHTFDQAAENPETAAAWALSLPEGGKHRDYSIRGVAAYWQATNPEQARLWAEGLSAADRKAAEEVIRHNHETHAEH